VTTSRFSQVYDVLRPGGFIIAQFSNPYARFAGFLMNHSRYMRGVERSRRAHALSVKANLDDRASLAMLIDEILPPGPRKLLNKLHGAETRQLIGAYVFEGKERRIHAADQIARTAQFLFEHCRSGPLE
jgi:hypothetical protein